MKVWPARSVVKSPEALADIIRNLALARRAVGAQRFISIVQGWDDWNSYGWSPSST